MGGRTEVIELCGGPCNSHESRKLTFVSKTGHLLDALTSPHVRTNARTFTAHQRTNSQWSSSRDVNIQVQYTAAAHKLPAPSRQPRLCTSPMRTPYLGDFQFLTPSKKAAIH